MSFHVNTDTNLIFLMVAYYSSVPIYSILTNFLLYIYVISIFITMLQWIS